LWAAQEAAAALGAAVCRCQGRPLWQAAALWLFVCSVALAQCSLAYMAAESLTLMRALSEEGSGGGDGSRDNSKTSRAEKRRKHSDGGGGGGSAAILRKAGPISWPRLWAGLWVESAVLPLCVLWTLWHDGIEWSGIRYRKRHGKVVVVGD
jgi:hypothetical protein